MKLPFDPLVGSLFADQHLGLTREYVVRESPRSGRVLRDACDMVTSQ